jgi:hypothetical protein
MKVFVVTYHEWTDYEGEFIQLREIFDSMDKAHSYVSENADETYRTKNSGADFEIDEMEIK